tara:strand:- start:13764 stop:15668 length:1905 start_codon:yes stop_codon:yes gene_type:complete
VVDFISSNNIVSNFLKKLYYFLDKLKPYQRRLYLVFLDISIFIFSTFFFDYAVLDSKLFLEKNSTNFLFFVNFIVISISFYLLSGQYKGISKFINSSSFYDIFKRNLFLFSLFYIFANIFSIPFINPFNTLVFLILLTSLLCAARVIIRDLMIYISLIRDQKIKNIVIYGAGESGAQLGIALKISPKHKILFYVDDLNILNGRTINGIKIYNPEEISKQIKIIDEIYLAIPSLKRSRRREIFNKLKHLNLKILEIPSIDEISKGNMSIDSLRPISIERLLGRDIVPPNDLLLKKSVLSKNVCVTGAGGSIGSEICKQIIKLDPKLVILFERSEFNLYKLEKEIKNLGTNIHLITILGCVTDAVLLENVLRKFKVDIIFHAAAYKHVPLVEINPISGLLNNLISTKTVCELSAKLGVSKVILISTDKAVRPTNVMGCSKRLSELIFQSYSKISQKTIFSIVRFGNVLDSSGSVVPLFREQIRKGGPITLTHPDIIRFFMTISEASQLVLQSSVLAEGGEVFLLDMGSPVLIKDLALQMIKLSGLTLKDSLNPSGDIEIKQTGLRPGEKLFEELLIDGESMPTAHPLIFKAKEKFLSEDYFFERLEKLYKHILNYENDEVFNLLRELVPEWEQKTK